MKFVYKEDVIFYLSNEISKIRGLSIINKVAFSWIFVD